MQERIARAKAALVRAQDRQKSDADKHRRPVSYEVGQQVLLSTANIRFKGPGKKKLAPKWIGPYPVAELVGPAAVRLDLPQTMKIHPVFHVSLVKPFKSDGSIPPPDALTVDGDPALTVEAIRSHRDESVRGGTGKTRREYMVKFENVDEIHNQYQPERNLRVSEELSALIDAYENNLPPELRNPYPVPFINWDDVRCQVCKSPDQEETMLLCSKCSTGWHMHCLTPPLESVPQGRWYCPPCDASFREKRTKRNDTTPTRRSKRLQR